MALSHPSFPTLSTYYTEQHPKGTSSLGCLEKLWDRSQAMGPKEKLQGLNNKKLQPDSWESVPRSSFF